MNVWDNIDPEKIPLTLQQALDLLPEEDSDGWYYELRKQRFRVLNGAAWLCAKSNWRNNTEACNNIGSTPLEAIYKMLLRLNIVQLPDPA